MQNAIETTVSSNCLRRHEDKITFNAFWCNKRKHKLKRTVCFWIGKANWFDAMTGEGSGVVGFAKTAFNLTLPEFMERFGQNVHKKVISKPKNPIPIPHPVVHVHQIWNQLQQRDSQRKDFSAEWLKSRGFDNPRLNIGSGFCNIDLGDIKLFPKQHHSLIRHRVSMSHQLIAPLRGVNDDQVKNFFIRAIADVSKDEKSCLLTGAGGWSEPDGSPRAFGFPHLIHDFPSVILCEGMADYFAVECLLNCGRNLLPIGATNACALVTWAKWLIATKYQGRVIILYQLDKDSSGIISSQGIGEAKAVEALKILLTNQINASLFKWPSFLKHTGAHAYRPNDIADVCKIYGSPTLSDHFLNVLQEEN